MQQLLNLVEQVQEGSGIEDFILMGGNVIDANLGRPINPNDVDLIVETDGSNTEEIISDRLRSKGFTLSDPRTYYLLGNRPVELVVAKGPEFTLDMALVAEPMNVLGPIDALSMYLPSGSAECVDDFGCMDAIYRRVYDCLPHRNFTNENPFIILSLLFRACAKYGAPLLDQDKLLREFNLRKTTHPNDTPFLQQVRDSVSPNTAKAIYHAQDREAFMADIVDSNALVLVFDGLQAALLEVLRRKSASERVQTASSAADISKVLQNACL